MPSLNYHHLLYFWAVAKEGTIARAAEVLGLAQPTISGQIKALEASLGEQLFARRGRNLHMTETGELVFRYADAIFTLGEEMVGTLEGRPSGQARRLNVGISDAIPKMVAHRVLSPVFEESPPIRLQCQRGPSEVIFDELLGRKYDLVLADRPITVRASTKVFNHLLGESGVSFFASAAIASDLKGSFPGCLDSAPFLIQASGTPLRMGLDQWFDGVGVVPDIRGEFTDTALMKEFGRNGGGVFAISSAVEREVVDEMDVLQLGRTDAVVERFYMVSAERKVEPPGLQSIVDRARTNVFGSHVAA